MRKISLVLLFLLLALSLGAEDRAICAVCGPREGSGFEPVKATARSLRELLELLGLPAYLKTTGSRGLHVVVPLRRREGFDAVRDLARVLARIVVSQEPGERTLEQRKSRRRGRVFLDTNRNAYAQTMAPAYAVRARRGAPVPPNPIPARYNTNSDLTVHTGDDADNTFHFTVDAN